MAPTKRTVIADPSTDPDVPERWQLVEEVKKNGKTVRYYTNVDGQKHPNKEALMQYITYAKEYGLSIYAPDHKASSSGNSTKSKKKPALRNKGPNDSMHMLCSLLAWGIVSEARTKPEEKNQNNNDNEVDCATTLLDLSMQSQTEIHCARALLHTSNESTGNNETRSSRRLAGLHPEFIQDFISNRALEYVIKEKPHQ